GDRVGSPVTMPRSPVIWIGLGVRVRLELIFLCGLGVIKERFVALSVIILLVRKRDLKYGF
ncbi:hypothetical protein, partial [Paenibacillus apiarius]|uniref:hypothetical protein n=1 Tax=Paenibacillus apiarius TaxID=46240 RepID=UPI003B3A55BA